ncbi:mucin-2-like [Liolophura sinensis]|uniref:mucin-2-like n=1 Tax=Liolophura sinensis TaxID=3198878 RepID=UPI003158B2CE
MKMGPQEDYIETVFTCKGDFNDPNLHLQLEEFYEGLRSLLLPDSCQEKLILKKVEPWNSVRVTFNIPRAAALKLKQLAQQGDTNLRRLGVLAVQIEGDQSISLTIAGKNNERTELVFKTGSGDGSVEPSMSVLDAVATGSSVEATRKNIKEYLRQSDALLDPFLSHLGQGSELLKSPNVVATSSDPIPFLTGDTTTLASSGKSHGLHSSPLHGLVFPAGRSPTGYPTSPSLTGRSVIGSNPQKYNSYPHGRPGAPPARQTIGNLLLPPPPPYPHPQVVSVNSIQKQNRPMTSSSPLLVNLLQNDPSGGLLHSLAQGKLPELLDGSLDAIALAKKKRRKRKKKQARLAAEAAAREAEMVMESVPNTAVTSTSSVSLPGFKKSVKKSKPSVSSGLAADHSTQLSDVLESAADKLVNPYTGLLEPADASGDSTSGSSLVPDQQEKIDTIQAAINRVAAAWTEHTSVSEDTVSTNVSSVLTSSSSSFDVTVSTSPLVSLPQGSLPAHSLPCSSSPYVTPLSAAPSFDKGTSLDALAISSVCDRPTNDPHHRPYDMNFSQSNKNKINPNSEGFQGEPLLAMQHVAYSVGLPSGPRQSGPISIPSHMQPQLSMQETFIPKTTCTLALSKPSFNTGDVLISRIGGLPGGHSVLGSTVPEKSRSFTSSVAGETPQLPLRRHAGTPPHSVLASPPMTSQAERPRSTGSYPLSRAGDGKGLAEAVSKISPHFQSIVANVHPGNHGQLSFENERTRIQIQSPGTCVSKGATITQTQSQNILQLSETQTTYSHPKVDIPKKGNDEINNSNHDSGLSSQSEAADENLLTDETASSCGTQGSPILTVAENIKVEHGRSHVKVETHASIALAIPTSSHPISHHHAALSGNPLYHKDSSVQAMMNCSEALMLHNPTVASTNPTVLHWNTASGSQAHADGANLCVSAERDGRPTEQKNVLLQKQCDKEQVHQVRCQSPENTKTTVSDGMLVTHSRESDMSLCHPEVTHLSVNVSSVADLKDSSHPTSVRDKGMVTVSPYRTQGYAPSSGAPLSYCGGDTYGNYHTDKGRSVPIMSATVYQGHKDKGVGELAEVKPRLQSSAISIVPGLPDLRTAKLFDNASSACPESDTVMKNMRLHKPPAPDSTGVTSVSGSVSSSLPLTYKSYVETVPRLGAVPSHNSSVNFSQGYSSSVDTHSVNSYVSRPVPISSQQNDTAASRTQTVATASAPTITENCRPSANLRHGSNEALNYNQHYVNPLNVQMCNTASSVSASTSLEAAHGMTQPTATAVTSDPYMVRTSYTNNTTHGRTSVSQSPVKLAQVQKVNTHSDANGPMDFGEHRSSQREVANCHINDHGSQQSDSVECMMKSGGHAAHPNLPVITGDILDQELIKNCNSNDVQMIEDHAVQNYISAEPNPTVQRGICPGLPSSSLRAGSPDHLKGSNVTSMYTRKSPTSKSGGGGNMLNMFASVLPLPKLLTESMQKVVKPLPGSAKDPEASVKLARRNQGHPNLLSHNASSSYSKSPPLGYESVQGASSVLTPPKSPVRFGPGEAMTMGLPKPQSPRTRSPHVFPAPGSHPALPLGNMPISSSFNSTALTRMAESRFPTDGIDHNGQDIPKRESVQATDSLNNGPSRAQGTVDSAHVQSWNGANTQPSGQQQITHEQTSVETTFVKVEATTGSLSGADTAVSESNTMTTVDVTVSESNARHEPSAIQNFKTEHSGKQVQTGVSEHSEGQEGQDLCKAKLSYPSQSSIMHHVSSVETPACDQTTVGNTTSELSVDGSSAQIADTEQCKEVKESNVGHDCPPLPSTRSEKLAPTSGVESSNAHTEESSDMPGDVEESAKSTAAEEKPTFTVEEVSVASGDSKEDAPASGETKERVLTSGETLEKASASVESKEMASACADPKEIASAFRESKDVVSTTEENREIPSVSEDSNRNASASWEPNKNAGTSVEPGEMASAFKVPQEKAEESLEPNRKAAAFGEAKEQTQPANMESISEDTHCPVTIQIQTYPSTAISHEPCSSVFPQANPEVSPPERNLSEDPPGEAVPCAELKNTERGIEVSSESPEQDILPNSMADVTEGQDIPVEQSTPEGLSGDPPFQAPACEPEMSTTVVESGQADQLSVSAVTEICNEVHLPTEDHKSSFDSNTESICDNTQSLGPTAIEDGTLSKPEEEHLRPYRSARKISESEIPLITKTLRGGKQIEEAPRAGRATKTPKRKEEDNGNKVSPEAEASPQLRQRRSRRRLPDADGNAGEHTAAKRSRVDGLDETHGESGEQDGVVLMDGESNDSTSCDHNDIGDSADHTAVEGTHVDNAHPDADPKNSGEEKAGIRQQKDTRRGSDASKPVLRDSKRDVKQNAAVTDSDVKGRGKASERVLKANEEEHVTRSSRRNRQSPSGVLDKSTAPATRDRSPVCRTRNRTPDQREESPDQQYKRTTRSTKPKEHPEPVTTNRRRRTSRDHR